MGVGEEEPIKKKKKKKKKKTHVERYRRLSTETFGTYIQDAAEKLSLTFKL